MEAPRKITVEVPPDLLEKAQLASGRGITQTVQLGLQLVAASQAYPRLRQLRGKVRFSRTFAQLKADREPGAPTLTVDLTSRAKRPQS